MKWLKSNISIHLLIAVALSLVINFSYLLTPIITERGMDNRDLDGSSGVHNTGTLHLERDLHAYIICDCELHDSVYVSRWQVQRFRLNDHDHLHFTTRRPRHENFSEEQLDKAHLSLGEIVQINGEDFDPDAIYDRPSHAVGFVWQILHYALASFLLIVIMCRRRKEGRSRGLSFAHRFIGVLLVVGVAFYLAPVMTPNGLDFFFKGDFNGGAYFVVLTKTLFMLVVAMLYTRIFNLMRQRQQIVVENERLKTENMTTRYNMLVGQINPHFFFNSLNSLAMLVRECDEQRALEYIDQLSYTFRYIIQNGQSSTTTLKEEIEFANAYIYLFKIRYADKLFFDIDIDERYCEWTLPALSLQPLIGNAVKHNSITTKRPLRVSIRTVDGVLEIENPKQPKLDVESSTGIGLQNLRSRWHIITGEDIEIVDDDDRFLVRLPLKHPNTK